MTVDVKVASRANGRSSMPTATLRETLAFLAEVVIPTVAKGVILRRPNMVALAERFALDRRAVQRMQRLQARHGTGPLLFRTPVKSWAAILAPEHVHRVLDGTPEPFTPAADEKRAALSHFEPHGVLISQGADRADRRRFNEAVLDTDRPMHRLAERFLAVVDEEARCLLGEVDRQETLTWETFTAAWYRVVRRVVLGDAARDDVQLIGLLNRLRSDANWAFLRPARRRTQARFFQRLDRYVERAEPGSLASVMAATPASGQTAPSQQVPQWLFAADAAGIATYRALALLATHPDHAGRARLEIGQRQAPRRGALPYLRACVLDALRLWPTTPLVVRQTTATTTWDGRTMPAQTGILIFAPYFHRDDRRLPYADRFAPELWPGGHAGEDWPLIPFSGGPAICPGRNLVLLLTSHLLASLMAERDVRLLDPTRLDARQPLPGTLNHAALRFALPARVAHGV